MTRSYTSGVKVIYIRMNERVEFASTRFSLFFYLPTGKKKKKVVENLTNIFKEIFFPLILTS